MILCPIHDDNKPSMKVYGDVAWCFVCNASMSVSELNLPEYHRQPKPEPTNVEERLRYIRELPTKIIRGLQLPYDSSGYYLVWPNNNYYKRRNWEGKTRYIGPSGVKAPLYISPGTASHLVIVEGELNCESLYHEVWGEYKFVSPGSASEAMRHIKYYMGYKNITIFADYDAAGIVHFSQVKELLLKANKKCNLVLMKHDFNDILTSQDGGEGVREFFERNIR